MYHGISIPRRGSQQAPGASARPPGLTVGRAARYLRSRRRDTAARPPPAAAPRPLRTIAAP